MTLPPPLARRIKTQVTGRTRAFFAVAGPGLESLCRGEIAERLPDARLDETTEGGTNFEARLHEAYAVNLWSATASRVLMRIGEFTADGFGRLKRRAKAFPWELYIAAGAPLKVSVALHQSRLYHKEGVAERIREALTERLGDLAAPPDEAPGLDLPQTLYVRAMNDRFTLSLDMSGDHLHKRGVKTRGGEAPLRETVAAAILRRADYDGRGILLDPMCGTGTFSIEAALMAKGLPPGGFRRFAFEQWPSFQPGRWGHLKQKAEKGVRVFEEPVVFASDRRAAMVGGLKEAARAAGMTDAISVSRVDFFDIAPAKALPGKGLLVLNPPYGRRMATPEESEGLYREIGRKLLRDFKGWRFAVVTPAALLDTLARIRGRRLPLFHGGLDLTLILGDIH